MIKIRSKLLRVIFGVYTKSMKLYTMLVNSVSTKKIEKCILINYYTKNVIFGPNLPCLPKLWGFENKFENPALSLFPIYALLSSCKKSNNLTMLLMRNRRHRRDCFHKDPSAKLGVQKMIWI